MKRIKIPWKRCMTMMLAIVMIVGLLPIQALAVAKGEYGYYGYISLDETRYYSDSNKISGGMPWYSSYADFDSDPDEGRYEVSVEYTDTSSDVIKPVKIDGSTTWSYPVSDLKVGTEVKVNFYPYFDVYGYVTVENKTTPGSSTVNPGDTVWVTIDIKNTSDYTTTIKNLKIYTYFSPHNLINITDVREDGSSPMNGYTYNETSTQKYLTFNLREHTLQPGGYVTYQFQAEYSNSYNVATAISNLEWVVYSQQNYYDIDETETAIVYPIIKYDKNDATGETHEERDAITPVTATWNTYTFKHTTLTYADTSFTDREGYTFDGWNTKPDGTGTSYDETDEITGIADDITLYAQWKKKLTVTYDENLPADANGNNKASLATNTAPPEDNTTYYSGDTVDVLGDNGMKCIDARGGELEFLGWSTNKDETDINNLYNKNDLNNNSFVITEDTTLYAIWGASITYYADDKTSGDVPSKVEKIIIGSDVYLEGQGNLVKYENDDPNDYEYDFLGWQSRYSGTTRNPDDNPFIMPPYNVELEAVWLPKYAVTYYSNRTDLNDDPDYHSFYVDGKDAADKAYTEDDSTTIIYASDAGWKDINGYVFLGWSTDKNATAGEAAYDPDELYEFKNGNLVLYAVWERYYTVTYDGNENTTGTVPEDDEVYKEGSIVSVSDNSGELEKTGYTFSGWNTEADGSGTPYKTKDSTTDSFVITENVTLYAQWMPNEHKVTYIANGGKGKDFVDNVHYDDNYTVRNLSETEISRAGYEFLGWDTEEDGSGTRYEDSETYTLTITKDVTLYAQWEQIPGNTYYEVIYDGNGGTGSLIDKQSPYVANDTVDILDNTFTKIGYTFTGFKIENGDGTIYASEADISDVVHSFEITSNVKLVAQWTADDSSSGSSGSKKYTVTYNANGGTGSHTDSGLSYGTTYTVKSDSTVEIEREGYTFTGWNTASGGTGTAYSAADTFKITGNVTLYAQWKSTSDNSSDSTSGPALNTDDHMAYVIGYPDNTVRPESNITRAEVATIFFRLLTTDSRNAYWSTSNSFSDVSSANWFNNAVSTMSNAGIIAGYTDGTFGANQSITRAEFAAITARFDTGTYTGANKFSDISGHWAAEYINRAAENGWITGYNDGTFNPDQYITRAEAMTLINRVLERDNIAAMHADMKTWSDNPSTAWYYEAVQEATNSHEYTRSATNAETWTKVTDAPDWAALEKSWSTANSI